MAIDPYAACPGGTGKKIKFCCADLTGELEQIDRLVEGDQVSAALEQVDRLAVKHPGRACLMATQVKLQLATRKFAEAADTSRAFLAAFPDNPLALGHAAVADAIAGRIQEAAAHFDRAREAAGAEISADLVRIAATLVQAGAQAGHSGFAQGLVEWMIDKSLGTAEEQRLLAAVVGSSGVPAALRTKVHLEEPPADSPWRPDFETGLQHARAWRLGKAITAFRGLKGVAGESRALFTDIAALCEMLARPFEAAEAWLAVASMPGTAADDAVEATGRAIALETEADEDRSPSIAYERRSATLTLGADGAAALDLLEDKLRHDAHFDPAPYDRSQWTNRGAVPPRSAWRVFETAHASDAPARLLATLLVFGRQTDQEPLAVLQGFQPDVAAARPVVERLLGTAFGEPLAATLPAATPTSWLLGAQFRTQPPDVPPAGTPAGAPSALDVMLESQRSAVHRRFVDSWPDTALPELLGRTPREALGQPAGARRVAALVNEGEATGRGRDESAAWTAIRGRLGMPTPPVIESAQPLEQVPPLRWHRLDFTRVDLDQLRAVFLTAVDAGFELAAELAADALVSRADATPEDRWEAYSLLEERASTSVRKLEIIGRLRELAKVLKVGVGMIDVAELRIRLQRGDQADIVRLLDGLRRDHARDQKVLEALAQVLMEAGVDLPAMMAAQAAGGVATGSPALGGGPAPAGSAASGIWTPGASPPPPPGQTSEKKTLWTPN
ncbi:MAG: hypothetical protein EBR28_03055 [Planctomycetia bacterium]|nr:hypothetical protein [Planctomycetia bacterium]